MLTLREMQPGERGVIIEWTDGAPELRLLEMGVLEGTEFEIVRLAPFGDPIEIRIRGYHVLLRKSEAGRIRVERHDSQSGRTADSRVRNGRTR
jgi:Fe2+ transport system protein FeoA